MKNPVASLDATPSKRLYLSIIADYDLNRSICELADNALDVWSRNGRKNDLNISISLDATQQTITVEDNAGGLAQTELRHIVAPGQTGTSPSDQTIGIFGVGTKRAVVALSQDVKIKTRNSNEKTHQIEFDEDWLKDDETWELPVYEVDDIASGATLVELQKLRIAVSEDAINQLKQHLSATYALFLEQSKVSLKVNGTRIKPTFFENWAYPPGYSPRKYIGTLPDEEGRNVAVEVVAGLSRESSPATGEYGVYFYCNDRLVARAVKTMEVGFIRGLAGAPHPKVSLTRVLMFLKGDARSMPWNSSKSDIDTKHPVFVALREWLVRVVKDYSSVSRAWMGEWPDKVFKFETGEIETIVVDDLPTAKKSYLPPIPKTRVKFSETVAQLNRKTVSSRPWAKGLYEGVVAAELISRQKFEQKNRIALVVLDSTLEIAFKDFLVYESGASYSNQRLVTIFGNRPDVHKEVGKFVKIPKKTWNKLNYYYNLRNKLVHEKATAGVTEGQIADFRAVVEKVLRKLHKLKF